MYVFFIIIIITLARARSLNYCTILDIFPWKLFGKLYEYFCMHVIPPIPRSPLSTHFLYTMRISNYMYMYVPTITINVYDDNK